MRQKLKSKKSMRLATERAIPLTIAPEKRDTKFSKLLFDNKLARKLDEEPSERKRAARRIDSGGKSESAFAIPLFVHLPELIRPELAAAVLGISVKTIYDWRYRFKQRKVPKELFVKVSRSLLIRTNILRQWIASQNPSLREG
jgi:hypothetical protein